MRYKGALMGYSRIITGKVMHSRLWPVRHDFGYPLYLYAFDLDELEELDRKHWWFGYNRLRLISIHDSDYLASKGNGAGSNLPSDHSSIRERLDFFLCKHGIQLPAKVKLVTNARFVNYTFNPASFFLCYDRSGVLSNVVLEINNTFDERHIYLLSPDEGPNGAVLRTKQRKCFHVSPFNDMQGDYAIEICDSPDSLDIKINIEREGKTVFFSRLWGETRPLGGKDLLLTFLRYPLSPLLPMVRILRQAAKLYYTHKLPVFTKPKPSSPLTIKPATPRWRERFAMRWVCSALARSQRGRLVLTLPRGEQLFFGAREGSAANLKVHRYKFFWRLFKSGAVGIGESYQKGEWDSDAPEKVLQFLIANHADVNEKDLPFSLFGRVHNYIRHKLRPNSFRGSRENISAHYDLGNDFFAAFLDRSMTYSAAYFSSAGQSLESAQEEKIDMILTKAKVAPEDHILEIGSGWGSLALRAARMRCCRCTSITLSTEQLAFANRAIERAGLQDKAEVRLEDYRKMTGKYDKIISIEMLEAVGHENLGKFFATCESLLKPSGIVVLQVITMPEKRYKRYLRSSDWIQKHIFPGACVPSLKAIIDAIAKHSNLIVEDIENIAPHYARTLAVWRDNFMSVYKSGKLPGASSELARTWEYYFLYCEAAFANRFLGAHQIVLTRPGNTLLIESDAAELDSSGGEPTDEGQLGFRQRRA
ncbi:MAG: DUF1365 family protein [Deltaproteobacteria bacterium]|nr:DUF1365 family protein [Deltaproteobacteria bacterium]